MAAPDIDASLLRSMGRVFVLLLALALPSGALGQVVEPAATPQPSGIATQSPDGTVAVANQFTDPTANAIAQLEAAVRRQDDLREASERFLLAQIAALEDISSERVEQARMLRQAESQRVNEVLELREKLLEAESNRVDEVMALRADYQAQLAQAEAKRIDAIRTVDVNAVQTATERQGGQADVLSQQVAGTAETQRAAVAATSQGFTDALERLEGALSDRIAALEASENVGQGRSARDDPAFVNMAEQLRLITERLNTGAGESAGSSNTLNWISVAIGAVLGLIGIVAFFFTGKGNGHGNGNGNGRGYRGVDEGASA